MISKLYQCKKCEKLLPLSSFHKDTSRSTGHHPYCKKCRVALEEQRRRDKGTPKKVKNPNSRLIKSEQRKILYAANPEKFRKRSRKWGTENKLRVNERSTQWRKNNQDRARINGRVQAARRRARKIQASPPWCDHNRIREIFLLCPNGFDVDHIIPLVGITKDGYQICGLHVHWNLQYLSATENRRKRSTMRPEDTVLAPTLFNHIED